MLSFYRWVPNEPISYRPCLSGLTRAVSNLQPNATATLITADVDPWPSIAASMAFSVKWGAVLQGALSKNYLINDVFLVYSLECGSVATLGFTNEALGFVLFLRRFLPLKLEIRDWSACEREVLQDQPSEYHAIVSALKSVKVEPDSTVSVP